MILLLLSILTLHAQSLRVGIKPSEPWVMIDKEGNPKGFSIDLAKKIAQKMDKEIKWVRYENTNDIIEGAKRGKIDFGLSAITINTKREAVVDFSHSMYELGLQIMVSAKNASMNPIDTLIQQIKKMFSFSGLFYFLIIIFVMVNLRWYLNVRSKKEEKIFDSRYLKGIYETFWWALTMLITWEAPKSKGASRVLDLSWHIMGLLGFSLLTAMVTSSLTAKAVGGSIKNEKDLINRYVGAVATDAPREFLEHLGANVVALKSLDEGMRLLQKGEIEALVHDGPRLKYLANKRNNELHSNEFLVLPHTFNHQNYGIVFKENSPLQEDINRILLELRSEDGVEESFYDEINHKWFKS